MNRLTMNLHRCGTEVWPNVYMCGALFYNASIQKSIRCKNPGSNFQTEKTRMKYNRVRTLKTLLAWFQAVAGSFLSQFRERPSPFYGSAAAGLGICTQWGCFHPQGDGFLHPCCVSLEVMTRGGEIITVRWGRFDGFPFGKTKPYGDQRSFCWGKKGNAWKWWWRNIPDTWSTCLHRPNQQLQQPRRGLLALQDKVRQDY